MTKRTDCKRFVYYRFSQMIKDDLTGKRYNGNKEICDLLNKIDDKRNENAELYFAKDDLLKKQLQVNANLEKHIYDIEQVCSEYHIKFEDVADLLRDYLGDVK